MSRHDVGAQIRTPLHFLRRSFGLCGDLKLLGLGGRIQILLLLLSLVTRVEPLKVRVFGPNVVGLRKGVPCYEVALNVA